MDAVVVTNIEPSDKKSDIQPTAVGGMFGFF